MIPWLLFSFLYTSLQLHRFSLNQIVQLSIGNESTLLSSILCSLFPELSWNIDLLKRCFKCVFVAFRFGYLVSAFLPAVLRRKLFWQIFVTWPVQNKKKSTCKSRMLVTHFSKKHTFESISEISLAFT